MQCFENRFDGLGIFRSEFFSESADLLWMIFPDVLGIDGGEADFILDSFTIPRLTHAESIHFSGLHVRHHLRRRNGDKRNISTRTRIIAWMDTASG